MRPYVGLRDPLTQARLWRQSRAREQIERRILTLRKEGAPYLASCLEKVGPQHGPHVTNALPGLSWHQWGEALDCMWVVSGKAVWSHTRRVEGLNGFRVYAEEASRLGLSPGGLWKSFADWPHVQFRRTGGPADQFPLRLISETMQRRFGDGGE